MQWSWYEAVQLRSMEDVSRTECVSLPSVEKMVALVEGLLAMKNCWFDGLSPRVCAAITNAGYFSKKQVKTAILENRLNPGTTRNYGCKSHYELCGFLGIDPPEPLKKKKPGFIWRCPHCEMFVDDEEHKTRMWKAQ